MEAALIQFIQTLAGQPVILAICAGFAAIVLLVRRRDKIPAKVKEHGTPIYSLVIKSIVHVQYGLLVILAMQVIGKQLYLIFGW